VKILLYDLEITPILGWTYEMWDARVIKVEQEPYIMSLSWKWLGEEKVRNSNIQHWIGDPECEEVPDGAVVSLLWSLMDKADIVVAHNAKKFDNRVATARFMQHGMPPPSPYKTVDTLLAARRYFKFGSNSLNDLCHRLDIGQKPKTTHASLWHDCLDGDEKAWKKMVKYNNNDVVLLEKLYLKLRPYITNHPNVCVEEGDGCPRCGSLSLQSRGYYTTNVSRYHRLCCNDCGAWSRERIAEKGNRPEKVSAV
jgi:hypothetical protein